MGRRVFRDWREGTMEQAQDLEQHVMADTIAEILHVHRDDVYRLARRGQLPHVRIGKRIRFNVREIREFLAERTRPVDGATE